MGQNSPSGASTILNNYNIDSRRYRNRSEAADSSGGERDQSHDSGGDRGHQQPAGIKRKTDAEDEPAGMRLFIKDMPNFFHDGPDIKINASKIKVINQGSKGNRGSVLKSVQDQILKTRRAVRK